MTRTRKPQTALTQSGRKVVIGSKQDVFEGGVLVGRYTWTWSNDTYPTAQGARFYATQVFVPCC